MTTRTAVAIGNFDGVHLGHRALIAEAKRLAKELDSAPAALTFEPHPRQLFAPEKVPFRLTNAEQKQRLLTEAGAEVTEIIPFDRTFAAQSAENFVQSLLVDKMAASAVVVGNDFRFGNGREGGTDSLRQFGEHFGFQVQIMAPVLDRSGVAYSSTRVRAALAEADFAAARRLLGHAWQIEGEVFKGQQLGRTIGIPTANIHLHDYQRVPYGIYAAWVTAKSERWPAAMYLGKRPTVDGQDEWLEAFLLDFDDDLYGQAITVEPVKMIRPDQSFDSLEALKTQMDQDVENIRALLLD